MAIRRSFCSPRATRTLEERVYLSLSDQFEIYLFSEKAATVAGTVINRGCDPELANNEGRTMLHYAAENGNVDIVRMFVHAHLPLDVPDKAGTTAKDLATKEAILSLLEDGQA